ncbi:hypothetical protein PUNSTDRAFT_132621 [Punctularia strigosozonata HHB-11173 SS5]|uniref:uncharacterized protein n=1 Tax=Punctularia strigosozonata (strain HHB-11173) TaxID=741275 RepID=UPI0004416F95|nr:uncharacterized protein PUNSTDRAFT_132621 [Punctularia strigosozonata HHB-11173 SS5]EIN10531.1 hypothetical protein PUNSTDRAFT_132621 [Punctularia strigosozonata HHB-11173 SS5]
MPSHEAIHASDLALLDFLTSTTPPPPPKKGLKRRDADLDPLLLGAAAGYRNVTRNHYCHDFFPAVMDPELVGSWDWSKWTGEHTNKERVRLTYVSRQAPRSYKVKSVMPAEDVKVGRGEPQPSLAAVPPVPSTRVIPPPEWSGDHLQVRCMARTRIPTPHGPAFLHLYHNNRDTKEHMAIVIDPAQLSDERRLAPAIRSSSLDAPWCDSETEMDRIVRGAYIGRLSQTSSKASPPDAAAPCITTDTIPSPLVRIHSECFTGETVGSMRCDCGEQLDEAIRLISQPITIPPPTPAVAPTVIPGRGVVVYMRQEGRGIGLLSKIRAYNLQDLGHDTVTANLMLGHGADERGYEIACAILRDLGLGQELGEGVRLLTNNPDKVHALEKEGLKVVERVPMVPRSWQARATHADPAIAHDGDHMHPKLAGATLIGGGATHGNDLDKYLRTKVLRMGHMLSLVGLEDQP